MTECCRQFQASLFLFTPFPQKVDSSNLQVAGVLARCMHLMRTLCSVWILMNIVLQLNLLSWRFMLTALFKNRRILKFKTKLTFAFFPAVNHFSGPLRKQNFTLTGSKGHGFVIFDWWLSIRFVCFCVSWFVSRDCNCDWQQWKMRLWRQLLNFRVFD